MAQVLVKENQPCFSFRAAEVEEGESLLKTLQANFSSRLERRWKAKVLRATKQRKGAGRLARNL